MTRSVVSRRVAEAVAEALAGAGLSVFAVVLVLAGLYLILARPPE